MPYWKIKAVRETFFHDHPGSQFDARIYDPNYDVAVRKTAPSIFFGTNVSSYFNKERVDTVIVTGCNTSGFPATEGWDAVTGWGSPYLPKLLEAFGLEK